MFRLLRRKSPTAKGLTNNREHDTIVSCASFVWQYFQEIVCCVGLEWRLQIWYKQAGLMTQPERQSLWALLFQTFGNTAVSRFLLGKKIVTFILRPRGHEDEDKGGNVSRFQWRGRNLCKSSQRLPTSNSGNYLSRCTKSSDIFLKKISDFPVYFGKVVKSRPHKFRNHIEEH